MIRLIYVVVAMFFGCSLMVAQETIPFQGEIREYRIYVPSSYDGSNSVPLVFNLHGYTSNNGQQEFYSEMNLTAEANDFIVVYPNSLVHNGTTQWNIFYDNEDLGVDDVGFIGALIDSLSNKYNIDLAKVYSCGMSMGGFMSYRIACEMSNRIAAIASVTGLPVTKNIETCGLTRTVPVMQIHGTEDPTVSYEGITNGYLSVDSTMSFFAKQYNCDLAVDTIPIPDINTDDSLAADKIIYRNCSDSAELWLYKIYDGGHTWPGAPITIGPTCQDFEASDEIWDFFSQYKLDSIPSINHTNTLPDQTNNFYPNPAKDVLYFEDHVQQLAIFDMTAKRIDQAKNVNQFSISHLPVGIYILRLDGLNMRLIRE